MQGEIGDHASPAFRAGPSRAVVRYLQYPYSAWLAGLVGLAAETLDEGVEGTDP